MSQTSTASRPLVSPWAVFGMLTFLKALMLPAYRSTDFEVHRNWLAITHTLPVSKWYYENTSEWTLDYPPLFAWFEWLLSQLAVVVDPQLVEIHAEAPSYSWATVAFQRASVAVTDVVFFTAVLRFLHGTPKRTPQTVTVVCVALLANFALFLLDHIHFQYNGMLFGILLWSLALMQENKYLLSAAAFCALLLFKHLYIYVGPAFFVYLLRRACWPHFPSLKRFRLDQLLALAVIVIGSFGMGIAPFVRSMDDAQQVLSRLFPFGRGLCHAYWAPNFWALYSFVDVVGLRAAQRFGLSIGPQDSSAARSSLTGGLVTDTERHMLLPAVTPPVTFAMALLAMMYPLFALWRRPKFSVFLSAVSLCGFASFLFGWHVHEKAILVPLIPLICHFIYDQDVVSLLVLSQTAAFSLFPLIFTPEEQSLKIALFLAMHVPILALLRHELASMHVLAKIYCSGQVVVFCVTTGLQLFAETRYEFLPLMLTSVYAAVGVLAIWIRRMVLLQS